MATEIMPHGHLASDRQITYIRDLLAKRNWQCGTDFDVDLIKSIEHQLQADEDDRVSHKITAALAHQIIDLLLSFRPHVSLQSTSTTIKEKSALLAKIPLSKYALPRVDGTGWDFFEVVERHNVRYLNRLIGAPGDWTRDKLSVMLQAAAAKHILEDPKASAVEYAKQHGRCAVCESPLSDPASIARSMGPVCAKRF